MSKNILVIDDEEGVRNAFTLALEDSGYDVSTAVNGKEGMEKFTSGDFHLVYLDLKMPVMDGPTTLRRIREASPEVPVYIVTAFHKEYFGELKKISEEGLSFELLHKPVSGDQIREVTDAILG